MKIENRKLEWNATPKTKALNDGYVPGGGDKKVILHLTRSFLTNNFFPDFKYFSMLFLNF